MSAVTGYSAGHFEKFLTHESGVPRGSGMSDAMWQIKPVAERKNARAGFQFSDFNLNLWTSMDSPVDCDLASPEPAVHVAVVVAPKRRTTVEGFWKPARPCSGNAIRVGSREGL